MNDSVTALQKKVATQEKAIEEMRKNNENQQKALHHGKVQVLSKWKK